MRRYVPLLVVLFVALSVRSILTWSVQGMGLEIVDEQHYASLASNVVDGIGFAFGPDEPTSIRPPLYPFFVAGIWATVGEKSLQAVRWAQVFVALLSIWLLYEIGCRWFDRRTALVAAAGLAIYPSLLFSGVLVLTETVFVALLLLFLYYCARIERQPSVPLAVVTGAVLALASLTRSVMWPFILVVPALAWFGLRTTRRKRVFVIAALVGGYVAILGPWVIRNTALQGAFTVVDTMGGLNLYMGNYEHTPEDRMWDAISLTGDQSWAAELPPRAPDGQRWTERTKEQWAQRRATAFIRAYPWTTLRRDVLKFADFWSLERDFIAGVYRRYYAPPFWFALSAAATINLAYTATAILAVVGMCLAPPDRRAHVMLLAVIVFVCGVHSVVFGHSRYHLPLIPILLLYAGAAVTSVKWRQLFTVSRPAIVATVLLVFLVLAWSRDVFLRDLDRIRQLVSS